MTTPFPLGITSSPSLAGSGPKFGQPMTPSSTSPSMMSAKQTAYCWCLMNPDVPSTTCSAWRLAQVQLMMTLTGILTVSLVDTKRIGLTIVQNLPFEPPGADPASMAVSTLLSADSSHDPPLYDALFLIPLLALAPAIFPSEALVDELDHSFSERSVGTQLGGILLANDEICRIVSLQVKGDEGLSGEIRGCKLASAQNSRRCS